MLIKVAIPNQIQLKLVPSFSAFFMGKQNDVHYIGGAEVLPAPLEAEEEARSLAPKQETQPVPCSSSTISAWLYT